MSSKLLLNLQPDPNTGTLSQQLVNEAAEVLRYELGSGGVTATTVTLSFYDGTSNAGTLLGTVDIPAATDVDTSPVTGTPGWSASTGIYVEVTAGEDNWVNGQSFVDVARTGETDVRREADIGSSPLVVEAGSLAPVSPAALTTTGSTALWPVIAFDAATNENALAVVHIPDGYNTVNIKIRWTNIGAGSGNVDWRAIYEQDGDGGTLDSGSTIGATVTATAPAQNVQEETTLVSGVAVTAGNLFLVRAQRLAANAADTLANDAGLLAVVVERAS